MATDADKLLHALRKAMRQQKGEVEAESQDAKATKIKKDVNPHQGVSEDSDPGDHADGTGVGCDPDDHADGTGLSVA